MYGLREALFLFFISMRFVPGILSVLVVVGAYCLGRQDHCDPASKPPDSRSLIVLL